MLHAIGMWLVGNYQFLLCYAVPTVLTVLVVVAASRSDY